MIGIAIINYMTYSKTIDCVSSIRKTTERPFKIYLLENGSSNDSADVLLKEYGSSPDVKLIISSTNHGYARGNNICIQHMRQDKCDYGVISNNDIICNEGSIDRLINDLISDDNYLLFGPMICNPQGELQSSVKLCEYSPVEYIFKSTYLSSFRRQVRMSENEQIATITKAVEVKWVSGAFFAFDLSKFFRIGDFDPYTFLFYEEYILAAKAKNAGFKLGYDPSAKISHFHGASTGGGVNIKAKIEADRSERYYIKKYSSFGRVFLYVLESIRFLEVVFTFGKKREWHSILKYIKEVNLPLKNDK